MSIAIQIIHLFSVIFLGGAIILSIAAHFKGDWAIGLLNFIPLWKKLLWIWGLLIIILFFFQSAYPWHEFHGNKKIYFNLSFLILRNILYFLALFISLFRINKLPSLSLLLCFLVGNFFAFDWAMSKEGHWFSNMYGLIYLANGAQAAMSIFLITNHQKLKDHTKVDFVHLLLTCSIVWFYLQICQFIIIWMGNIPRESIFYIERWESFGGFIILIAIIVKLIPVAIISLFKSFKQNTLITKFVSFPILMMCFLEVFWLVRYK